MVEEKSANFIFVICVRFKTYKNWHIFFALNTKKRHITFVKNTNKLAHPLCPEYKNFHITVVKNTKNLYIASVQVTKKLAHPLCQEYRTGTSPLSRIQNWHIPIVKNTKLAHPLCQDYRTGTSPLSRLQNWHIPFVKITKLAHCCWQLRTPMEDYIVLLFTIVHFFARIQGSGTAFLSGKEKLAHLLCIQQNNWHSLLAHHTESGMSALSRIQQSGTITLPRVHM